MFGFLMWMLSNYYPTWGTVVPAAIISGLAFGPMFTGQASYYAIQGMALSKITNESSDNVISRLFGFFFCLLYMGKFKI